MTNKVPNSTLVLYLRADYVKLNCGACFSDNSLLNNI
jgi:hypothetical protein